MKPDYRDGYYDAITSFNLRWYAHNADMKSRHIAEVARAYTRKERELNSIEQRYTTRSTT